MCREIGSRLVLDFRAHSSMDRVSACGAEDTSSIPVGRTFKQKPVLKKSGYFFIISRRQIPNFYSLF